MTNFKPRCGFLGCDPAVGQCLGFCDDAPKVEIDPRFAAAHYGHDLHPEGYEPVEEGARPADEDLPPLDIDFNEPTENKDGSMQMLAWLIILVVILTIVFIRFA